MLLRDPCSGGEGPRNSSRDTDDLIISFSDTDGPIVLWAENEISRDPGEAENISEVPGEESDILQASLVDDKGSDVSGIRGDCCRVVESALKEKDVLESLGLVVKFL